ncbi:hypothetical protein EVG20_g1548 [Dentipellis fragilis]|uniref:Uncharacterized protein n=1 Tax=Dentipellis fragilis TaxID=205917 RepID=A0A4Y9ZDI4_9AGAM|nr:hypothetical protein EVG20_g1548 [Dentipellis fragilis]
MSFLIQARSSSRLVRSSLRQQSSIMTGVEAASAITKLSDIIAGAIFTTLAKRIPQNQVKAGDKVHGLGA